MDVIEDVRPLSAIISSARTHILLPTDSTAHSTMPHKIPTAALIPSIRRCRTALSCLRLSRLPLSAASICFLPPFFVFTLLPIHTKTLNFLYSTTPPFCQYHSAIFHHKRMNASFYKLRRRCKHKIAFVVHMPQSASRNSDRTRNGYAASLSTCSLPICSHPPIYQKYKESDLIPWSSLPGYRQTRGSAEIQMLSLPQLDGTNNIGI